jgi:hypothetical protein
MSRGPRAGRMGARTPRSECQSELQRAPTHTWEREGGGGGWVTCLTDQALASRLESWYHRTNVLFGPSDRFAAPFSRWYNEVLAQYLQSSGEGAACMGVIDSVSEGLAVVRRRPAIMLMPVLVDLCLWFSPQLSVEPLAVRLAATIAQGASGVQPAESLDMAREALLSLGKSSNLLGLLASSLVGMPSLLGGGIPEGMWRPGLSIEVASLPIALILTVGLGLIGLVLAALYLTTVASAVQGQRLSIAALLQRAWATSRRLIVAALTLIGLSIGVAIPASLFVSLLAIISPTVASMSLSLLSIAAIWIGLWMLFYLFFVVDAMVLQEVGLQRAVLNSVIVVRSSFWSALGFIILVNVLAAGLSVVWQWVAVSGPLGSALAVGGNTFIGSGLVAASFVFYRERYEALVARISGSGRAST